MSPWLLAGHKAKLAVVHGHSGTGSEHQLFLVTGLEHRTHVSNYPCLLYSQSSCLLWSFYVHCLKLLFLLIELLFEHVRPDLGEQPFDRGRPEGWRVAGCLPGTRPKLASRIIGAGLRLNSRFGHSSVTLGLVQFAKNCKKRHCSTFVFI